MITLGINFLFYFYLFMITSTFLHGYIYIKEELITTHHHSTPPKQSLYTSILFLIKNHKTLFANNTFGSIKPKKMEEKHTKGVSLTMVLFLMAMSATFQGCFSSATSPPPDKGKSNKTVAANNPSTSSVVLPITGNVYPLGYLAFLNILGFTL